jgi:Putative Actinobacterial Holin-X, holin superfamily III
MHGADGRLVGALSDAAGARLQLFEAEFKRAAWTAAYMGAMAITASLLALTAWLVLAASLVYAAVAAGAPWWLGALIVIAAHGVGAALLLRRVHSSAEKLTFGASRRAFVNAFRWRARSP